MWNYTPVMLECFRATFPCLVVSFVLAAVCDRSMTSVGIISVWVNSIFTPNMFAALETVSETFFVSRFSLILIGLSQAISKLSAVSVDFDS